MTELMHAVRADRIPDEGLVMVVEADPGQRAAVAVRLLLPGIARLHCRWMLQKEPKGAIKADGMLQAEVFQECVVSLEPFAAAVADVFTVRFVIAGRESAVADDPEEPDELSYNGVTIDLGEATVEQLALALDPYPRAPGAVLPADLGSDPESAFAALAKLPRPD